MSDWISTNPALAPKPPRVRHHPTLPYDDDEFTRLLAAIDNWRYGTGRWRFNGLRLRALFLVLRHTGLRIKDGLTLGRHDVIGDRVFLYQGETGLPVYVPVPTELTADLAALPPDGSYYFFRGHDEPTDIEVEVAYQVWRRKLLAIARHANVAKARYHRFRDTFAVSLLARGVSLELVSTLLGHASIKGDREALQAVGQGPSVAVGICGSIDLGRAHAMTLTTPRQQAQRCSIEGHGHAWLPHSRWN